MAYAMIALSLNSHTSKARAKEVSGLAEDLEAVVGMRDLVLLVLDLNQTENNQTRQSFRAKGQILALLILHLRNYRHFLAARTLLVPHTASQLSRGRKYTEARHNQRER